MGRVLHGKGVEGRFEWTVSVDSERNRERERGEGLFSCLDDRSRLVYSIRVNKEGATINTYVIPHEEEANTDLVNLLSPSIFLPPSHSPKRFTPLDMQLPWLPLHNPTMGIPLVLGPRLDQAL